MAASPYCFDDPERLFKDRICLKAVSKNLKGKIAEGSFEKQDCVRPKCKTLKHVTEVSMEVMPHECDSPTSTEALGGTLTIRTLITAFEGHDVNNRGYHAGSFVWTNATMKIEGNITGLTNVGTHRKPVFDACQKCHEPRTLEGRLSGRFVESANIALRHSLMEASYRLKLEENDIVQGTLEGVIITPCN